MSTSSTQNVQPTNGTSSGRKTSNSNHHIHNSNNNSSSFFNGNANPSTNTMSSQTAIGQAGASTSSSSTLSQPHILAPSQQNNATAQGSVGQALSTTTSTSSFLINNNNFLNSSSSSNNGTQAEQVEEIMSRISTTVQDKLFSEAIFFFLSLLSISTAYYSIYRLNPYIFHFRLFIYTMLVLTRRFVSRLIKVREACDPFKLQPSTPILVIIHSSITLNIMYLFIRIWQETNSYISLGLLLSYHMIYYKFGMALTEKEHQFGLNHDLVFYFKVLTMKLAEIFYFSFLLPYRIRDKDVPFNMSCGLILVGITCVNTILFFAMEIFTNIGMLNRLQAKKLGFWKQISAKEAKESQENSVLINHSTDYYKWNNQISTTIFEWRENQPYKRNIVVTFKEKFYRSIGKTNLAMPGIKKLQWFYMIFHKVQKSRKTLIIGSGLLMVFQDFLILKTKTPVVFALSLVQTLIVALYLILSNRKLTANFN